MKPSLYILLPIFFIICNSSGLAKPPGEYQPPENMETITVNFHFYVFHPCGDEAFEYIPIEVPGEKWREKILQLMPQYSGIYIRDLWYEGTRLFVDLYAAQAAAFNMGSFWGYVLTAVLVETMKSLPYTEEILILVEGQPGHSGDHFNFARIFQTTPPRLP